MWSKTNHFLIFGCLLLAYLAASSATNHTNGTTADNTTDVATTGHAHSEFEEKWAAVILFAVFLMILMVLIIWVLKAHGFVTMNETGFCMIFGMIIGAVVKYTASVSLQERVTFHPEIFFYALMPPSIFFAGYDISRRFFFRNIGTIFIFAFVGTVISFISFAGLMFAFVKEILPNMFADFEFHHCLVFGSLISATDPVTVLAIFQDLNVPGDLYSVVFGESCLNDAVAIILYRAVVKYETREFSAGGFFEAVGMFIGIFVGSIAIGWVTALVTALITKQTNKKHFPMLETGIMTLMSYAAYLLAELGGLSGLCCVLFCGISQAHYTYPNLTERSKIATSEGYAMMNFLAEKFTFFYMGVSVFTFQNHQWNIEFIAWTFFACALARFINLYMLAGLMNITWKEKITLNLTHMLWFSGLRGPIAFALAFTDASTRPFQLILTSVCVVGIVTIIINGSLTTKAMQLLKIQGNQGDTEEGEEPAEEQHKPLDQEPICVQKWMEFDRKYMKPFFNRKPKANAQIAQPQVNGHDNATLEVPADETTEEKKDGLYI